LAIPLLTQAIDVIDVDD